MAEPLGIARLNPLTHMSREEYTSLWQQLFATILNGIWGRLLFFLLIGLAFWTGVRQRNPALAGLCIVMASAVAYGAGVIDLVRSVVG